MIPFVRDMNPAYGESVRVSPLIRRVTARNPGPFTYLGTGTYIVGAGEVAVIDPGPLMDDHLDALMRALEGERVSAILTTHTHLDHSPLARPLAERTGATLYGRPSPAAAGESGEGEEGRFTPDVVLADGRSVTAPGWTLTAIETPGHASNHLAFAFPEEKALFSGDHVMGWSTTVVSPPDGDMTAYYASLDRVEAGRYEVLWPTHGAPIREVAPFVAAYREHRLERERQVLAELAGGETHIKPMVARLYAAVDPRLHPAAARSLHAHLIHLVRTGQVVSDGPSIDTTPVLDAAYRLAAT